MIRRDSADCASYRGHDGVREWFRLQSVRHVCQIVVSQVRGAGDGQVLVTGSLTLGRRVGAGPACARHRIDGGLIATAHHHLSVPT